MKDIRFLSFRHTKAIGNTYLLFFIFLFLNSGLKAQNILQVSSNKESYNLYKYIEIFEDKTREITFSEIQSPKFNTLFKKNKEKVPNFGYTKSAYWIRFYIKNISDDKQQYFISFENPNMHYINAYIPAEKGYKEINTGRLLPLKTREISKRNFVFKIIPPKDTVVTVYIRVENGSSMALPLLLLKPIFFERQEKVEIAIFSFIYGVLAIMIFYYLFIFFSFREDYYLYYSLLMISFLLFHLSFSGVDSLYLWPDNYYLKLYAIPFFIAMVVITFIKFQDAFFDLKRNYILYHKIDLYNIYFILASLLLLPFIGYQYYIRPLLIITLLNVFFSFYLGITMWRNGFKEGRYFLFAGVWLGIGTIVTILTRFSLIESVFITTNAYQLGMLLLVLFFSFALADKFNIIQKRTDKINRELVQSEERFKKLANLSFEGVLIHRNGVTIDCNDPLLEMFGYQRKDIIGQNIVELVVPKNERKIIYSHLTEGKMEPQNISCINKRGAKLAIEIETRRINEQEQVFVTTFRNISEQKRSQIINDVLNNIATAINFTDDLNDLNKILKEELNILFDTTDFYIALYEQNKIVIPNENKKNENFEKRICDLVIKEKKSVILKGKEIQEYLSKDERQEMKQIPNVWMGVPFYLDSEIKGIITLRNYKSEEIYNNTDLSLLEFISKQVSDEIKRKQTDDQIRILSLSVEQSPVSIVITDVNGSIEYVNPAFERTTGYSKNEAIGENPRVLKSGKLAEQIYEDLWNTITAGKEWHGEFLNKKKNGDLYWERAVISPVFDNKGEIKHYMAIKEDITEQKTLQQQLRQSQKMDSLGKLAGGVAHDFNNLLTVINGFSEIALTKIDKGDNLHRDISSIHSAGKKAENLVRQLLSFSSLQSYQPDILNINNIISNLNKMMRRLISEDIHIEINLAENLPFIQGNEGQVEQVLINLIVNARDAINQKTKKSYEKKIEINTSVAVIEDKDIKNRREAQPGRYVLLKIVDNGIGMNENIVEKIFEPFYTTKERGKGTGLGLATVYGIVKQSNGWVDVSSLLGVGTTFEIYWPTTEKEEDIFEENNEKQKDYLNGGNETILLVEDDADVRELVQSALENYGYHVYTAIDGLKGFEFIKNKEIKIDLLVTDLIMPNLNGKELAEKALQIRPDLRILYTSGYTDDQLVTDGAMDSEIDFLQKPYSVVILLKKVREILDRY